MSNRIEKRRDELLGKEFETNSCGKCFIIDYLDNKNLTVAFYEPFFIVKCSLSNLKAGKVLNPLYPSVYNKGCIGLGCYSPKTNKEAYSAWFGLIDRCYGRKSKYPTYKDVTVCEDWLNFQNFAQWYESQNFCKIKDDRGNLYHLDKDLLTSESKEYSPKSCCLLPQEINNRIKGKKFGNSYIRKVKNSWIAETSRFGKSLYIGSYSTKEEALLAYKTTKESCIKEVAEKWKGKIDDKVHEALMNWEVDVDN